ncbi:MAG: 6-carboxytetrahydropterin synthase [Planctomycetota bacterium]
MFSVTVRDRFMIAHSFEGAIFGPAQALHGATYVTDVTFYAPELDGDGLVVDIGAASSKLASILGEFNFKNLDDFEAFRDKNTTTEFMAKVLFDRVSAAIQGGDLGEAALAVTRLKVSLMESDVAFAAYESDVSFT